MDATVAAAIDAAQTTAAAVTDNVATAVAVGIPALAPVIIIFFGFRRQ